MPRQIFVNPPIRDLQKSQTFFRALGLEFNPQLSNDKGASLVIAENIYAMLLVGHQWEVFWMDMSQAPAQM